MALIDRFGRRIRYLRLSVTGQCGMRCQYCRPRAREFIPNEASPGREPLKRGEIVNLVGHLVRYHGVEKVRLTGGEPTLRRDLSELVASLAAIDGLRELVMTTNGLKLAELAPSLADAGLKRVNVSLDTLNPERFRAITGVDGLDRVLEGLRAAKHAGLLPIRVNCVVMRGVNDDELDNLLGRAFDEGWEIRFIEFMPMGPLAASWQTFFVSAEEMRSRLKSVRVWRKAPERNGVAEMYDLILCDGRSGRAGFITAMTQHFCDMCDRLRITADGHLHACLMTDSPVDLLPALRPTFRSCLLDELLEEALSKKQAVHPKTGPTIMTVLGG